MVLPLPPPHPHPHPASSSHHARLGKLKSGDLTAVQFDSRSREPELDTRFPRACGRGEEGAKKEVWLTSGFLSQPPDRGPRTAPSVHASQRPHSGFPVPGLPSLICELRERRQGTGPSAQEGLHGGCVSDDRLLLADISVQFSRSVVSDPLRPHGLQHARPPCPSPKLMSTVYSTHVH